MANVKSAHNTTQKKANHHTAKDQRKKIGKKKWTS
jgi:hypothetical protein